jgi:tetratricopeptide (TPR) repeat protein
MARDDAASRGDPRSAKKFNSQAFAWEKKGEFDNAIADDTEAPRLDPFRAAVSNNRAGAWARKGDVDKALADCGEALRLDPLSTEETQQVSPGEGYGVSWIRDKNVPMDPKNRGVADGAETSGLRILECSGAMIGEPLETLSRGLRSFLDAIRSDPVLLETVWLSVIIYGSQAQVAVPLTEARP